MRVYIDAGHGSGPPRHDPGVVSPHTGALESIVALDIAKRLRDLLAPVEGIETRLSREDETYPGRPAARAARANLWRAGLAVSVHLNGATSQDANGFEVWCWARRRRWTNKLTNAFVVASNIVDGLRMTTPLSNRGVKVCQEMPGARASTWCRSTIAPAVLVECGFLTSAVDAKYYERVDARQSAADAIFGGIMRAAAERVIS